MSEALEHVEALARACRDAWRGTSSPGTLPARWKPLAARHRVEGLAASAAGERSLVEAVVARSLSQLAECRRLAQALEPIGPIFLKGFAVAALGYRDPLLKQSADIDLLVDWAKLPEAAALLSDIGYRRVTPRPAVGLTEWHNVSNQSVWENGPHRVELHHRAVPLDGLFPGPVDEPQTLNVGGVSLRTFSERDQLAYLAIHGALSLWFRLKWLVDFAALCERRKSELASDYAHADRLGAGRPVALGFQLSERMFGIALPADVRALRRNDPVISILKRQSLKMLRGGEPTERRFGTLSMHVATSLLAPSAGAILSRVSDLIAQRRLA